MRASSHQAVPIRQSRLWCRVAQRILDECAFGVVLIGRIIAALYARLWPRLCLSWYGHIYNHLAGPEQWPWLERGIAAYGLIAPNASVLDLCCGDGSYSGLLFARRAGVVDAIDLDSAAIRLASRRWPRRNVSFSCADVLKAPFPHSAYDLVILNAGMEYFSPAELDILFARIRAVLKHEGSLCGCTPILGASPSCAPNLRSHFSTVLDLHNFLAESFAQISIRLLADSPGNIHFFECRTPKTLEVRRP